MRLLLALILFGLFGQSGSKQPTQSPHVAGPNGLDGWTVIVDTYWGEPLGRDSL